MWFFCDADLSRKQMEISFIITSIQVLQNCIWLFETGAKVERVSSTRPPRAEVGFKPLTLEVWHHYGMTSCKLSPQNVVSETLEGCTVDWFLLREPSCHKTSPRNATPDSESIRHQGNSSSYTDSLWLGCVLLPVLCVTPLLVFWGTLDPFLYNELWKWTAMRGSV